MLSQGWITVRQAAEQALVSSETIHSWVDTGRLTATEYAHHTWISVKTLDEATLPLKTVGS